MRIYNQNIWGNFSAKDHCIANRNLLIKEMIEECSPDVCCFQECNPMTSKSGDTPIQEILKLDYVEIMPGTMLKVIKTLKKELDIPIIAGGLIETKKEVEDAVLCGAIAVSTGKREFWECV